MIGPFSINRKVARVKQIIFQSHMVFCAIRWKGILIVRTPKAVKNLGVDK